MTYDVDWEPAAVDLAARYLKDDPGWLRALLAVVDSLETDPRPENAFALGETGVLRMRVGTYRVVSGVHHLP